MKKILTILLFSLSIITTNAQAPQGMNYQAVVRDAAGSILANTNISFQFLIHNGSPTGPIVFTETQSTTTNQFGLVTVEIGKSNNLGTVDWGNGEKYLQTKMLTSGAAYVDMGTTKLLSVPYALYAANSNVGPAGPAGPQGLPGTPGQNGTGLLQLKKVFTQQELQTLQSGGMVQLLPPPPVGFTYYITLAMMIVREGTDTLGSSIHGWGIGGNVLVSPASDATYFNHILMDGSNQNTDFEKQFGNSSLPPGNSVNIRIFYPFSLGSFDGKIGIVMGYVLLDIDGML